MKIYDNRGHLLNANFSFTEVAGDQAVLVESRGAARNPDYTKLISLLLLRLGANSRKIIAIYLDSTRVSSKPLSERLVQLDSPFPIQLRGLSKDAIETLRKQIGSKIALMHREQNVRSAGGNSQRRILIVLNKKIEPGLLINEGTEAIVADDKEIEVPHPTLTQREQMQKIRVGQQKFRKAVLKLHESKCAISGIGITKILTASHIKSWSHSDDRERLDPKNGLLLSPTLDKLFDRGYIAFDTNGRIMISSEMSPEEIRKCGLTDQLQLKKHERHQKYLSYHRNVHFKK